MLQSRNARPDRADAFERVREWTRARFKLAADATVLVSEVACRLPGCPPIETVVAFWTENEQRHHFKLFKPVAQVAAEDLPPAWMKNALVAIDEFELDCC